MSRLRCRILAFAMGFQSTMPEFFHQKRIAKSVENEKNYKVTPHFKLNNLGVNRCRIVDHYSLYVFATGSAKLYVYVQELHAPSFSHDLSAVRCPRIYRANKIYMEPQILI